MSWMNDPATDNQKAYLDRLGINYPSNLTKIRASELIGGPEKPEKEHIQILKYFNISTDNNLTKADAYELIGELFNDSENYRKWMAHKEHIKTFKKADKSQKEAYKYFNLKIPRNLSYKQAEETLNKQFIKNPVKYRVYEDRLCWFEDTLENFNEDCEYFGCKKISKIQFKKVIESLESSGMSLEQIENNHDLFFSKALSIEPRLKRKTHN